MTLQTDPMRSGVMFSLHDTKLASIAHFQLHASNFFLIGPGACLPLDCITYFFFFECLETKKTSSLRFKSEIVSPSDFFLWSHVVVLLYVT